MLEDNKIRDRYFYCLSFLIGPLFYWIYIGWSLFLFQDDVSYLRMAYLATPKFYFISMLETYFPPIYPLTISFFSNLLSIKLSDSAILINLLCLAGLGGVTYKLIRLNIEKSWIAFLVLVVLFSNFSLYFFVFGGANSEALYFPLFLILIYRTSKLGKWTPLTSFLYGCLTLIRYIHIAYIPLLLLGGGKLKDKIKNIIISIIPWAILQVIHTFYSEPMREFFYRHKFNINARVTGLSFQRMLGDFLNFLEPQYVILSALALLFTFALLWLSFKKKKLEAQLVLVNAYLFLIMVLITNRFYDPNVFFGERLIFTFYIVCFPIVFSILYLWWKDKLTIKLICIPLVALYFYLNFYNSRNLGDTRAMYNYSYWYSEDDLKLYKDLYTEGEQFIVSNREGVFLNEGLTRTYLGILRPKKVETKHINRDGIEKLPDTFYYVNFTPIYQSDFTDFKKWNALVVPCDIRYPYTFSYDKRSDLYRLIIKFERNAEREALHLECLENKKAL
jgi:hypothetical protein